MTKRVAVADAVHCRVGLSIGLPRSRPLALSRRFASERWRLAAGCVVDSRMTKREMPPLVPPLFDLLSVSPLVFPLAPVSCMLRARLLSSFPLSVSFHAFLVHCVLSRPNFGSAALTQLVRSFRGGGGESGAENQSYLLALLPSSCHCVSVVVVVALSVLLVLLVLLGVDALCGVLLSGRVWATRPTRIRSLPECPPCGVGRHPLVFCSSEIVPGNDIRAALEQFWRASPGAGAGEEKGVSDLRAFCRRLHRSPRECFRGHLPRRHAHRGRAPSRSTGLATGA